MYKVIKDGELIGLVDEPRYVRRKNGVFIQCPRAEADGIAFNSQFYRFDHVSMDGYEPVNITQVDSGEYILSHEKNISMLNDDLADTQMALCDTYEQGIVSGDEITQNQLALAEVYELVL